MGFEVIRGEGNAGVPTFEQLRDEYAQLWESARLRPERAEKARRGAAKVLVGRAHYETVAGATGVPWYFIGLAHLRESYCNFGTHLHNGDSLRARTHHVPAGRPAKGSPPFTWDESAIDALTIKGLQSIGDWPIERVAFELERFNGFGYRRPGRGLTPYLWADTQHYSAGKFVRDGVFDGRHVDTQSGCMGVLMAMMEADPTILGEQPEAAEAVAAPKAAEEAAPAAPSTEAHFEMHDILKEGSWLYRFNTTTIKTVTAAVLVALTFIKEHPVEIAIAGLVMVVAFEVFRHIQRSRRISQ